MCVLVFPLNALVPDWQDGGGVHVTGHADGGVPQHARGPRADETEVGEGQNTRAQGECRTGDGMKLVLFD